MLRAAYTTTRAFRLRKLHRWSITDCRLSWSSLLCWTEEEGHAAPAMTFDKPSLFEEWHQRLLTRGLHVRDLRAAVCQPSKEGVLYLGFAVLIESEKYSFLPFVLLLSQVLHE